MSTDFIRERLKALEGMEDMGLPDLGKIKDMLEAAMDKAHKTTTVVMPSWEEEGVKHVLQIIYYQEQMPFSLPLGRVKKEGRKWRANVVEASGAMMAGRVTFQKDWSEALRTQREAIQHIKDGLITQGEMMVQQGSDIIMGSIMNMGANLPGEGC